MDAIRNARRGAAAVALGLGLAVTVGPAVALAEETESGSTDSTPRQSISRREATKAPSVQPAPGAQQAPVGSMGEPTGRRTKRPNAREIPQLGDADTDRRGVAPRGAAGTTAAKPMGPAATPMPSPAAALYDSPTVRTVPVVPAVPALPTDFTPNPVALPAAPPTSPAAVSVTPFAAAALPVTAHAIPVALEAKPSAFMTATPLKSAVVAPSSASSGATVNPVDIVTAALALVSREINRVVSNRTALVRPSATTAVGAVTNPVATYSVASNWGSGHTANVAVTAGSTKLTGWTVEFDTPATIVNIWNAKITSHVGNHYVISNAPYNAALAAGQTTSFGYQATPGAAVSKPTNIKVNGVPTGTSTPPAVPTISVADVTVAEGNTGTTNANVAVTLSKAATTPVSVKYATANGTAKAGTDYTAASGTLTFAPGVTSQTIAVKVTGDTVVEPTETFTVKLTNPTGATLSRTTATATITNDDTITPPAMSIADMSVAEGNGDHAHFMFTVTMDKASTTPVNVRYATSNGTATAGADYQAASGTITFGPGVTAQTIHVDIIGDTIVEPNETFKVTLSSPTGATIRRAVATGTITNDDAATPTPGLSISDASATEPGSGGIASGYLRTSGNQIIDSQGKPVQLSSANWFGAEGTNFAPHGLWTRNYQDMIDQMSDQGFNTIRLPYSSEMLHTTAKPSGIDYYQNPGLQGLSAIQVMDKVVEYAGQKGMRIVLDHHRSTAGVGTSENGLWYNSQYTEDKWVSDWQMLANRYKGNPTVIGFDLHNEPYNGTWGGGGATDWARAAERAGNAALAVNPNLLMFVEGVADYKGQSYWWGGNLMGVKDRPIVLNVPNRVVYSPHDYPNSVWAQPWFQTPNFGANLPNVFRQAWGYIYEENIAPIWVGEFGTKLQDPKDVVWFEAITSYLSGDFDNNGAIDIAAGVEDMSWAFWSWNPNSGDTGGILADDWRTINQNKMTYLTPILYTGAAGSSLASFTVTLGTPSTQTVTVQYATSNGTATAGSDYTASVGTLTFAPGETQKTIAVVIMGDSLTEGSENFHLMLSNPAGASLTDAMGMGTIVDRATGTTTPGGSTQTPTGPAPITPTDPTDHSGHTPAPGGSGQYIDLATLGTSNGSDHTDHTAFEGGRTAITSEALVAYNDLRRFAGLAPAKLEDVGKWAFAKGLTNNTQAWGNDVQGVGMYYAMQGAKVGWIADDKYNPQIVADIERTARLGSASAVMAMVAQYGHPGYANYLSSNGYQTAFINTLKMEPHYAGWMHDRAHGRLVIEGAATSHDLNHLTVLSHDQMKPFMNDTWDYPQWPALTVSNKRVIEYFQSMVTLGDPKGTNLTGLARAVAV
jgi:aryl-phospho-beta-D-glucosidase BglC (GH1 family)